MKTKNKPGIGISDKNLENIVTLLSTSLSDEMVLYIKTRNFHWNVSGESFMELHKLFEQQYKQLEEYIDELAERIGKLGSKTIGSMNEFSSHATLKESHGNHLSQNKMLEELFNDHESVIRQLRKQIDLCGDKYGDAGTADLLTGLMEDHETIAWILRRYMN